MSRNRGHLHQPQALLKQPARALMPQIDRATGAMRFAEIFVAVLGASAYAYAEATWTQQLPD